MATTLRAVRSVCLLDHAEVGFGQPNYRPAHRSTPRSLVANEPKPRNQRLEGQTCSRLGDVIEAQPEGLRVRPAGHYNLGDLRRLSNLGKTDDLRPVAGGVSVCASRDVQGYPLAGIR